MRIVAVLLRDVDQLLAPVADAGYSPLSSPLSRHHDQLLSSARASAPPS